MKAAYKPTATVPWRNRIVGYGEEAPDQLLANPHNFRIHTRVQEKALVSVLREIGLVQNVLVNRTTGHMIDGHLRAALAISEEQPTVPVTYVELSEDEEKLAISVIDPLSSMAGTDEDLLASLRSSMLPEYVDIAELCKQSVDPATFQPVSADEQGRLDQKKPVTCPACGHEFSPA